jgi:GDP-L-fucose synthase
VSVIDYNGQLVFDTTKPEGTPRKLLDVERLTALGWAPTIALRDGIQSTYGWFVEHLGEARL